MRSMLGAKAARLYSLQKGSLFALRRHEEPLTFGIMISEQSDHNEEPKVLLLNPNFERTENPHFHRVYAWQGTQDCISLGVDWAIAPRFREDAIRDSYNPPKAKHLALTSSGLTFCATHSDHSFYNSYLFSVDTLEPVREKSDEVFYLNGYKLYLSPNDYQCDREPIFEMK